MVFEFDTND